jgi:hypothetical protein
MLISKNIGDLVAVRSGIKRFQELAVEDGVPWTATHSLFANMGGFVIRSHIPERLEDFTEAKTGPYSSDQDRENSRMEDGTESEHGNEISEVENRVISTTERPHLNPFHLVAQDILALREAKLLRLPYITKSELDDKSKSDGLVRFIAILQILWTVIQIIVRHSRHLDISQLEIAVLAFSFCAIIIYGLNWEKPKGVQVPCTLLHFPGDIPQTILTIIQKDESEISGLWDWISRIAIIVLTLGRVDPYKKTISGSPVPNHSTATNQDQDLGKDAGNIVAEVFGLLFGGLVFGSIHVLAWNFVFPSILERTLWRVASILCTTMPLLFLIVFISVAIANENNIALMIVLNVIQFLVVVFYVAARVFLLVEIFRTLCFLPPKAYIATWATNVPHVA